MSCRKMLCQECTTQVDGINYCRTCVAARTAKPVRRESPLRLVLMTAFGLAMALALVRLLVGVGVYLVGM